MKFYFFPREKSNKKAPAVPSSYSGSASHYIPLLAKAVFERNGELLRASIINTKGNMAYVGWVRRPHSMSVKKMISVSEVSSVENERSKMASRNK